MNKKIVRLTEGDLHRIVKESVRSIINETPYTWDYHKDELTDEILDKLASNPPGGISFKYKRSSDGFRTLGYVIDVSDKYGLGYFHGFVAYIRDLRDVLRVFGQESSL